MAKVSQFYNKNQFLITTNDGVYFQSYDSVIAFKPRYGGKLKVTPYWDYSNTTRKHFYLFLEDYTNYYPTDRKCEYVRNLIKNNEIELVEDGDLDY